MKTKHQVTIRRAADRGQAEHGWLRSAHSFSFADYYDPAHMGFRSLRVINQDHIAPLGGFPTHPHRDMEIFSYVLEGKLTHQDSMGNQRTLRPGEIQLMSAGSGITHSEFNPSSTEPLHLLQIWIQPWKRGLEPSYTEWTPDTTSASKVLLISPDGRDHSATIHQDAEVHRLTLEPGERIDHDLADGRGLWLQLIRGSLESSDAQLSAGDALSSESPGQHEFQAGNEKTEALLFDLA